MICMEGREVAVIIKGLIQEFFYSVSLYLPSTSLLETASELHVVLLEIHLQIEIIVHMTGITGSHDQPILDPVGCCTHILKLDCDGVLRVTPGVLQLLVIIVLN